MAIEFRIKVESETGQALAKLLSEDTSSDIRFKIVSQSVDPLRTTGFHSAEWGEIVVQAVAGSVVTVAAETALKALLQRLKKAAEETGAVTDYEISGSARTEGALDEITEEI